MPYLSYVRPGVGRLTNTPPPSFGIAALIKFQALSTTGRRAAAIYKRKR
jgi:hypothetical protein